MKIEVRHEKFFKDDTVYFYGKLLTSEAGPISNLGTLLGNIGRSLLENVTYQISKQKGLRFVRRIFFKVFPVRCYGKQSSAWNWIIWAILINNHQTMLHTKYIGFSDCDLEQEVF